tara:strand:+ start:400 stop:1221 length:822 start_codon:yes stop_codon:yes gene_type:complete
MANNINMIKTKKGIIDEICQEQAITKQWISETHEIDPKTLRKINSGEEVKIDKVKSLSDKLKRPYDHFIDNQINKVHNINDEIEKKIVDLRKAPKRDNQLTLIKFDKNEIDIIDGQLKDAGKIIWLLDANDLSLEQIENLENFEKKVEVYRNKRNESFEHYSLSDQLKSQKDQREIINLSEKIIKSKLCIHIGSFLFWESSDEFYNFATKHYSSIKIAVISINKNDIKSLLIQSPDRGDPPKSKEYCYENYLADVVFINKELYFSRDDYEETF